MLNKISPFFFWMFILKDSSAFEFIISLEIYTYNNKQVLFFNKSDCNDQINLILKNIKHKF